MVLLYTALVASIIYKDDSKLSLQCYGNNRLMLGFNITSSYKDEANYIQAYNDIESNKLINELHAVPCNALSSILSNSCVNKSQCSMNFNNSFFNGDP